MKNKKKVVKYRKPLNINIGIIVFGVIFIYIVFNVFSYLTEVHISIYEVEQGTIAVNNIYNGLILREETIYSSDYSGALNYYMKEGSKAAYGNLICSVDENGDISNMINTANQDGSNIDTENLQKIEKSIQDFIYSYDEQSFYHVYTFKQNVNASLNEALSVNALNDISEYAQAAEERNTFHKISASVPGIVVYYTDGFESINTQNFTADMFQESNYVKTSLKSDVSVQAGTPVFKLIESENWNIVIPIEQKTAETLEDDNVVKIRFLKDSKETYAYYSITEKDGQTYLILSLKSGMVRYALERYVEIELLLSEETGLKIPNSAITEKTFFTIPIEYFCIDEETKKEGVYVERSDKKGNTEKKFVSPTVYYETETMYYIDSEHISINDLLIKKDTNETYRVGKDMAVLKGVYNINKGYAVFKRIDILYQNEEYTIVKNGTAYGIALYDHIALDGTKIDENQLINKQ